MYSGFYNTVYNEQELVPTEYNTLAAHVLYCKAGDFKSGELMQWYWLVSALPPDNAVREKVDISPIRCAEGLAGARVREQEVWAGDARQGLFSPQTCYPRYAPPYFLPQPPSGVEWKAKLCHCAQPTPPRIRAVDVNTLLKSGCNHHYLGLKQKSSSFLNMSNKVKI